MNILKLISTRFLYGILVLILVTTAISSLIYLGQVDPARLTFGQRSDVQTVEAKRVALGLDDPLRIQLARYLGDISPVQYIRNERLRTLDYSHFELIAGEERALILKFSYLRESYQNGKSVSTLIYEAFPVTLILSICSFAIAIFFGITLGMIAAVKFNSWIDRFVIAISSLGYSLPSYVVAILVAIVFAYYLQSWTGLNMQGSIFELDELGNDIIVWKNLFLPALALGIRPLAVIAQITRSSMLDVLDSGYIRTAKAKGLKFEEIVMKHAFPNALNPIGTAISGWFASLLAGAFFVETVFNFKGLGSLTVAALLSYDVPLILGCILFTSVLFIAINICTDFFYAIIDPRQKIA